MKDEKSEALRNLRDRIRAAGLTQREVAQALGRDPGQVSRLLNGQNPLNIDQQSALAKLLGCSVSELFHPTELGGETFFRGGLKTVPLISRNDLSAIDKGAIPTIISTWAGQLMTVPQSEPIQFAVELDDDSMSRVAGVGAFLLVDSGTTAFVDGAIVVLRQGEAIYTRRATGDGPHRRFEADSQMPQAHPPIYLDAEPAPEILGTVRGIYQRV